MKRVRQCEAELSTSPWFKVEPIVSQCPNEAVVAVERDGYAEVKNAVIVVCDECLPKIKGKIMWTGGRLPAKRRSERKKESK